MRTSRLRSIGSSIAPFGLAAAALGQPSPFSGALSPSIPYAQFNFPMDVDEDGDIDLLNVGYHLAYLANFGNGGMGPQQVLAFVSSYQFDAAKGDLNGDGRPDFAVVAADEYSGPGHLRVIRSTGIGQYGSRSTHLLTTPLRAVALGDVDRDGDLDAMVASNGIALHSFRNDGLGTLIGPSNHTVSVVMHDLAFIDVDGDGDVELACVPGVASGGVSVYSFDAAGVIEPPPTTFSAPHAPTRILVADLNDDDRDDIITAGSGAAFYSILLNNGTGGFHGAVTHALPASTGSIDAVDIDADGDLDLVFGSSGATTISIATNVGDGTMLPVVSMPTSGSAITHADLNKDGLPELIGTFLVPYLPTPGTADGVVVHWNRGDGRFALRKDGAPADQSADAISMDFDGDGHLDILCTAGESIRLRHGIGNGTFGPIVSYPIDGSVRRLCLADVNGDGEDDIAAATQSTSGIVVLLGTGGGEFADSVRVLSGYACSGLSAVDVDSDGDLDFVSAISGGIGIVRNNGDMTFQAPQIITTYVGAQVATAADVDGDGDPDIAATLYGQKNGTGTYHKLLSIYKNDGTGSFTKWQEAAAGLQPRDDVLLVDFDGDGDRDCLFVDSRSSLYLRRNDGNGTFGTWTSGFFGSGVTRISVADVNADGQLEVLAANTTGMRATVLTMYNGLFVTAHFAMRSSLIGTAITAGDFDEDGLVDIAVGGTTVLIQDDPASLPVDGACCTPAGACVQNVSGYECTELGGSFLGPTSTCLGVDCEAAPPPLGACCLGPYLCEQLSAAGCATVLGTYLGNGLSCAEGLCDPTGACCTAPYACVELTGADCATASGDYLGDDTTCAQGVCDPVGACCVGPYVCNVLSATQCAAVLGTYLGDGAACLGGVCDPVGACCIEIGVCDLLTSAQCSASGGVYKGDYTGCTPGLCDEPTGACCFACSPAGPVSPCPDFSNSPAFCIELSADDCSEAHGLYSGDNTACIGAACVCAADINGDGRTNATDFAVLASHFGQSPASCMTRPEGDLNCDGAVTLADFLILAGDFGCGN